ncbi:hypothetical protein ACHHYP_00335 [Achlya hypogyna]|uniref:Rap-GAP domain-containing protein n=1 Tax=Achlya hypogyna TaxID=1202772 RepID=A0A1V9ZUK9_ACHHY|nr:hypothetical protein ACHHYP_00335 [Achlya hypogyna]
MLASRSRPPPTDSLQPEGHLQTNDYVPADERKLISSPMDDDDIVCRIAHLAQLHALRRTQSDVRNAAESLGLGIGGARLALGRGDDHLYLKHITEIIAELRRVRVETAALLTTWRCVQDLLGHRSADTRKLAFDFIDTCLDLHSDRVPLSMRTSIFRTLLQGQGDYHRRQKSLRNVLQDGRLVAPFAADLGPYLLALLETSDAPKELLSLVHAILRRSPLALDVCVVTDMATLLAAQSDAAWTRGDQSTSKRFLKFMALLTTHKHVAAATAPSCLRTLCGLANANGDGVSTWTIMKHLLAGPSGATVLQGLLELVETPATSPYVLRGAVFFLGMSCWGSQRVAALEICWATILGSLRRALDSNHAVVVFEVVLSIQRLVKKYGDQLHVEWAVVLQCLRQLHPWLRATDATVDRLPAELLDTLLLVDGLVARRQFLGDCDAFFAVVQLYLAHCPEPVVLRLVAHRGASCHPTVTAAWSTHLTELLRSFFEPVVLPTPVRLATLDVLFETLEACRFLCEDRVLEEIFLPALQTVYDDPNPAVRAAGLERIALVAEHVETPKFHALVDVLHTAVQAAQLPNAQELAAAKLVQLFRTCFATPPLIRAVRMYELIAGYCSAHRNMAVRRLAVGCLQSVATANSSFQMQWTEERRVVLTSWLLVSSRSAVSHVLHMGCLPVAKGVVALLSMASTETNPDVLDSAVAAMTRMLENRFVLRDVDMSDVALKLVSCVECRAFGRAALGNEHDPSAWRTLAARYLTRGFELLLLVASTDAQLSAPARLRLFDTFVHGLDLRPSAAAWSAPAFGAPARSLSDAALQAAERSLAHTVLNGVGTLALLLQDEVHGVLPAVVDAVVHRTCATEDGTCVAELAAMGLELLLDLYRANRAAALPETDTHTVLAFALRALHLPDAPRQLPYLAHLVVVHVFSAASQALRGALATAALPLLIVAETALDEVVLDYVKSMAFAPPTTPLPPRPMDANQQVSWSFQNTIVTLRTALGATEIVVRRASGTTAWRLDTGPMDEADPLHVMAHLFDINPLVQHQLSGLDLLSDGEALTRALAVLDLSPPHETHKVGVLYVGRPSATEADVLDVVGGSPRYGVFLRGLGQLVRLDAVEGYSGGLDTSAAANDGTYGLVYKDSSTQVVFHVATMMHGPLPSLRTAVEDAGDDPAGGARRHSKKRHLGNDFVHIVYMDFLDGDPTEAPTMSGQFCDVRVFVQPLDERASLYRVSVQSKTAGLNFGPLGATQIVPASIVAEAVRLTCLNANATCRAAQHLRLEFIPNAEDRLKQIKLIGQRWKAS